MMKIINALINVGDLACLTITTQKAFKLYYGTAVFKGFIDKRLLTSLDVSQPLLAET